MRAVITLDDVDIELTEPRDDGPYPWLTRVGEIFHAARAGHIEGAGIGESSNVTIDLDNTNRQAADLLDRPLRARAKVYDDDDELVFDGLVSKIAYGRVLTLTLEA